VAADLDALTQKVAAFRDARDWAQFHSLRNLIVSLNLEAGELLELTQWKSDAEVADLPNELHAREALEDECADVLLYLLLIADGPASIWRPPRWPSLPRTRPSIPWTGSRAPGASTMPPSDGQGGGGVGEVVASRP
jgi:NTP pyrophosphatase (non-canonical NTP hydrolase)